jgi:glucokinase
MGGEPGMAVTIGVDIGGTKIAAGVVDEGGEVQAVGRRSTPKRDADAVVDVITELVGSLVRGTEEEILGVGLGVAGFVDAEQSHVLTASNLGWTNEPIRDKLTRRLGLPVVVENDANAAAWGEFRFGAGVGRDDMIMVTVGTGVGGGIVIDGRLQRGAHGVGAEFGHMIVVPDGRQCGCGRRGCWEQYASGSSLVRYAREFAASQREDAALLLEFGDGTPEGVQGLHVTEAAQKGDTVALKAFDTLGYWLGLGMADLAALLDPGIFVIGGGVIESGELILGPTRDTFAQSLVSREHRPLTPIVPALLGNAAGIVGAADLVRQA